jgi:hypothetical protein
MTAQTSVGQTIVLCGLPSCVHPEPGTGPSPLLFRSHQSRLDRIALDITDYFLQLSRRTYPVIVGLILPKRMSAAPQHPIGDPAGPALQPAHDIRHRDMWLPHCVHMVRHDRPSVKVVGMADGRTMLESILDDSGDAGVLQPERPRTGSVEPLVSDVKRNAARIFGGEDLGRRRRSGPGEAPSYKDNTAIREPMRKSAAINKHGRPQKTMVCPTAKNLTKI